MKPLPKEVDDHRMREADLTQARYSEALAYFKEDLSRQLSKAKATEDVTHSEGFWIAYSNRVAVLEGYTLRQAALLERARGGAAKTRGPAIQRFCSFLSKTRYLD